jgi:hypothetical protein
MEASESSEMLEPVYQTAPRRISEESYLSDLNIQSRKNLKYWTLMCIVSQFNSFNLIALEVLSRRFNKELSIKVFSFHLS